MEITLILLLRMSGRYFSNTRRYMDSLPLGLLLNGDQSWIGEGNLWFFTVCQVECQCLDQIFRGALEIGSFPINTIKTSFESLIAEV